MVWEIDARNRPAQSAFQEEIKEKMKFPNEENNGWNEEEETS